ncbi:zinc finger protein 830 [Drosophila navojoa]|uniref:zinc finger protein 830 n=1 Tax=Drosophila navojoa TaxID=7232 RepID=UPI0011BE2470|nr:zinc finger protein 830 [Drosophila navojoa]
MDQSKDKNKFICKNRGKIDLKDKFFKVDSPIAKYDSLGNLSCIICKMPIKPNIWKVHLNSKQHKQYVVLAKRQREFENISETLNTSKRIQICLNDNPKIQQQSGSDQTAHVTQLNKSQVLPEKFFDHEKSVSVCGTEQDPEAEWIKFQKEIREAATISNNIISEEQESVNIKRHLKEIDEQLENWKRFIRINDKKNKLSKKKRRDINTFSVEQESSSSEEDNVDNLSNWRTKSVHK